MLPISLLWGDSYVYTTIPNFIDLQSFNGSYLGILNNNLILTKKHQWGPHGSDYSTTIYEYIIDANGLVTKRTGTTTDNNSRNDPKPSNTLITYFEYKISK